MSDLEPHPERDDAEPTVALLRKVRAAEPAAMDRLLRHVWPRLQDWVRREKGDLVGRRFDTMDCAQDVALDLVRYLPGLEVSDTAMFDRILYRMIQNTMRNKYDYLTARRRRLSRERPLDDGATISLDPPSPADSPSVELGQKEEQAWIRVGLALLDPVDQELILRRMYDDEPFAEIGAAVGLAPDAARMRLQRSLVRLSSLIGRLKQGGAAAAFDLDER